MCAYLAGLLTAFAAKAARLHFAGWEAQDAHCCTQRGQQDHGTIFFSQLFHASFLLCDTNVLGLGKES